MANIKEKNEIEAAEDRRPMPLEEILRKIRSGSGEIVISDEEIQEQMLKAALGAQSIEELLSPPEVVAAKLLINRPLLVKSIRFNNSQFEQGPDVYTIIEANDGERDILVSCGAVSVMEKLFIAQSRGWLPAHLKIVQSTKATKAGFYPLDVVLADGVEEPF